MTSSKQKLDEILTEEEQKVLEKLKDKQPDKPVYNYGGIWAKAEEYGKTHLFRKDYDKSVEAREAHDREMQYWRQNKDSLAPKVIVNLEDLGRKHKPVKSKHGLSESRFKFLTWLSSQSEPRSIREYLESQDCYTEGRVHSHQNIVLDLFNQQLVDRVKVKALNAFKYCYVITSQGQELVKAGVL